jgi:hypothetical protein
LEPNDHEVLLVVARLAHYTRFGFALKPTAWSKFLGGGGDENKTAIVVAAATAMATAMMTAMATAAAMAAMAAMAEAEKATAAFAAAGAMTAMSDKDDDDDDNNDDTDDGYDNDGRQQCWRLPAPVPIDGAVR